LFGTEQPSERNQLKNKVLFVTCLLFSVLSGHGQVFNPLPPEVAPKGAPPGPTAPFVVAQPKSPRSPSGDKPINPDQPNLTIQAIVIVKSRADIQEGGIPNAKGLEIKDIPILQHPDFSAEWTVPSKTANSTTER